VSATISVKDPKFAHVPALLGRIENKTFHRPHQTESLGKEIQSLEWALRGRSEDTGQPMPTFKDGDDPNVRRSLEESLTRTRTLHDNHNAAGAPFNQVEKNTLYQFMVSELEPSIREGNPTHEMMERPTAENVDWWTSWHRTKKQRILDWRKIRRVLDPHNTEPNFCNVSILRTNQLAGGDPRRYWQGYEEIAFSERVETDIDAISDEQYLLFLTRRAQEWASVNICRELGWSKTTYEAAVHRLRGTDPTFAGQGNERGASVEETGMAPQEPRPRFVAAHAPPKTLKRAYNKKSHHKKSPASAVPNPTIEESAHAV
jgi:hypothetical protein